MSQPWKLLLSCMGWVWRCYCIFLTFICLDQKKSICFDFFLSLGCIESKNKTNCEIKSSMSSLNPSIIRFGSFKCKAGVPLRHEKKEVLCLSEQNFFGWGKVLVLRGAIYGKRNIVQGVKRLTFSCLNSKSANCANIGHNILGN